MLRLKILSLCLICQTGLALAESAPQVKFAKLPISSQPKLFVFEPQTFTTEIILASDYAESILNISAIRKLVKAKLIINASFFKPDGKPPGLIVKNSQQLSPLHRGGKLLNGIFSFNHNKFMISAVSDRDREFVNAIQTGPLLIQSGQPLKIKSIKSDSRSGLCLTKSNQLKLFITPQFTYLSFLELQNLLVEAQCYNALNLDGGNSSQLYLAEDSNDQQTSLEIIGKPVTNFLVFK